MTAWLKRYGILLSVGAALLVGGLAAGVALRGQRQVKGMGDLALAVGQEARDSRQDGELKQLLPLVPKVDALRRDQDRLLMWAQLVSEANGWPAPPKAADMPLPDEASPRGGIYAAERRREESP